VLAAVTVAVGDTAYPNPHRSVEICGRSHNQRVGR
jgi:hypothetical protein